MVEYGVDGNEPNNVGATMGEAYRQRELRIVALRASARIVANWQGGTAESAEVAAMDMADRFAQWLETGER